MNAATLALTGILASAGILAQPGNSAAPLAPKATEIREIREAKLEKPAKKDGMMTFSSSMSDKPGLRITLSVDLPKGMKLLDVVQPESITAKDSAGTDLTNIEESFHGDREYVQKDQFAGFDDENEKAKPARLTLVLGVPAREAKTFSVSCEAGGVVGGPVKGMAITPAKDWTAFDAPELAGLGSKYKLTSSGGQTTLEFQNEKPKAVIENVTVTNGGDTTKSSGWMSMNGSLSYTIDAPLSATSKVMLNVHTNTRTVPLRIDLKDVKLP
jgi:hypothetical protein